MPLWRIFSHRNTFDASQREALAEAITQLYASRGLPRFYVNVLFIDLDEDSTFVGGKRTSTFVRIAVEQIARTMPDPADPVGAKYRKAWMDKIHEVLRPHILDRKELTLEFHIYETPKDLWRIQGIDPPPANSEAEKLWVEKDEAVPWEVTPV